MADGGGSDFHIHVGGGDGDEAGVKKPAVDKPAKRSAEPPHIRIGSSRPVPNAAKPVQKVEPAPPPIEQEALPIAGEPPIRTSAFKHSRLPDWGRGDADGPVDWKHRTWVFGKWGGISAVAIVVVVLIAAIVDGWVEWDNVPRAAGVEGLAAPANGERILMIGDNTREGIVDPSGQFGNTTTAAGAHSDTLMVLYLPPGHANSTMLSVSRDLYVTTPGQHPDNLGWDKIDAALNLGAPTMIQTVEQNLGLPINHYVQLNFNGIQDLVDAMGGVDVCVQYAMKDAYSNLDIPAGCQTFDGVTSLAYVRARHTYYDVNGQWVYGPYGDIGREANQQYFLSQMMHDMMSPAKLIRFPEIASSAKKVFEIDGGFSYWHLLHIAMRFVPSPGSRIQHATLPIQPVWIDGVSFTQLDNPVAQQTLTAIADGGQVPSQILFNPNEANTKNPIAPPPGQD